MLNETVSGLEPGSLSYQSIGALLFLSVDVNINQLLLTLVQLVGESLLKQLVILKDTVNFDKTENYTFSYVSIRIAHEHAEHIRQVEQVLDEQRELLLPDVGTCRSLLDKFLYVSQLVLDHSKQCLQLRRLLLVQKRLNRVR